MAEATAIKTRIEKRNRFIDVLIKNRTLSLFVLIVLIVIAMSISYPKSFFSYANFGAILLSLSVDGVLAIGMMYLIVAGVFDLSVGSNIAVGGALTAIILKRWSMPIPVALLGGIATSSLAGLVNGFFVAKVGVNALIATLAMMGILRGMAILVAGAGVVDLSSDFLSIGQHVFLGLQMPVYYMLFLVVVFAFLLAKTRYFRQLYFIGGNKKAAALSGINVERTMLVTFVLMGLLCGITGGVLTARLNAAIGTIGSGTEMRVITAVIIGGGSLSGGRGTVAGAFMGALFMGILNNVMVIAGVNVYFQSIAIGLILLGAVSMDVILLRKYGGRSSES